MNKLLLPVAILAAVLFFSSCSEDFNIAAPYKTFTVVYGLLDQRDTAHYIRIEKAFLDNKKSALDMAKNPDSIYFSNLNVRMDILSNNAVVSSIPLTKVDLNNEGYPKSSGSFVTGPNYAYKFKNNLDPNYTYRLVVYNPATGQTDSAETGIISEDHSIYNIPVFSNDIYPLSIQKTTPNNYVMVRGSNLPPAVKTVEGVIRFHWVDRDGSGKETDKYADWSFGNQVANGQAFIFQVNNVDVYYAMRNLIGPAPSGISRLIDTCDMFLYMGSSDLYAYQQAIATQNSGLTGDEIEPNFTNIKGQNTLGLFAAQGTLKDSTIVFTNESLDSLMTNSITVPLNIVGRSDH